MMHGMALNIKELHIDNAEVEKPCFLVFVSEPYKGKKIEMNKHMT